MGSFHITYISFWSAALLAALILVLVEPKAYSFLSRPYWRFLFYPWKLISFLLAITAVTLIAPYSGDPTWDYVDALFMSTLTYVTAPWAVGTLYRLYKKWSSWKQAFVAICLWLFSASWSYDIYITFRDGTYPLTWAANLVLSSGLYLLAGMLWSLGWVKGRGVIFAFMDSDWLQTASDQPFRKILWYALIIMLVVAGIFAPFFLYSILY